MTRCRNCDGLGAIKNYHGRWVSCWCDHAGRVTVAGYYKRYTDWSSTDNDAPTSQQAQALNWQGFRLGDGLKTEEIFARPGAGQPIRYPATNSHRTQAIDYHRTKNRRKGRRMTLDELDGA